MKSPATHSVQGGAAVRVPRMVGRFFDCAKHDWSALNSPCPECRDGDAPRHCSKHGWSHLNKGCPECAAER